MKQLYPMKQLHPMKQLLVKLVQIMNESHEHAWMQVMVFYQDIEGALTVSCIEL